jgi:hypothetical protein
MDKSEIYFKNANSRETYFTLHNVKEAHRYSKGKSTKIGILDWLFGKQTHTDLYNGFVDVTGSTPEILNFEGHGYWMASVLKEIAPTSEIYAINSIFYKDGENDPDELRICYLEKAIDWAIENEIDILTYSHPKFSPNYQEKLSVILGKAYENNIITTFIHCDHRDNLWPYACMPFSNNEGFLRNPDYNILHFDYNHLFIQTYYDYVTAIEQNSNINSGNLIPYFSFSSMSPVLAGFVALLRSIKSNLTLDEIRNLLDETSYKITEKGDSWYDINECEKVIDIGRAVKHLYNS